MNVKTKASVESIQPTLFVFIYFAYLFYLTGAFAFIAFSFSLQPCGSIVVEAFAMRQPFSVRTR
jgi:hypothetical protein